MFPRHACGACAFSMSGTVWCECAGIEWSRNVAQRAQSGGERSTLYILVTIHKGHFKGNVKCNAKCNLKES